MIKNKTKRKCLLKGACLGFALMLCGAFFPANAISMAANWQGEDQIAQNSSRIEVDGNISENNSSLRVRKGDSFVIPQGEYKYYASGEQTHIIGTDTSSTSGLITSSSVVVRYQATGEIVKSITGEASWTTTDFEAQKLGAYVIIYTVKTTDGNEYSYDLRVICEANEANFEFSSNEQNIIPTIYDIQLANGKDIVLPLPTVNDEDGEAILTPSDKDYYIINGDGSSGIPGLEDSKNCYVDIRITNGSDAVTISKDEATGNFIIDGDLLTSELDEREIKITYSFYQVQASGSVFITSTSRTFTVRDGYYYKDSTEETKGYDIVTSWSTSIPDSAVVGREVTLPSVTGATRSSNSPASESIPVYYTVTVYKMGTNGVYDIDVTSDVITEDGTFKAVEEGSYRFSYTVTDFYGMPTTSSSLTFTIDRVRDTVSPDVYMYDAGDSNDFNLDENTYVSAANKLKTQTTTRNIIMYAIAGVDNMPSNTVTLRREIRDASGIRRFNIDEQAYNSYNLIFAPDSTGINTIYQQIVIDNYEIKKQMLLDDEPVDITDSVAIQTWLKDHKYLLVVSLKSEAEDVLDETIGNYDEMTTEERTELAQKMIKKGYAYIPATNSNSSSSSSANGYTFTEQSYSFYYFANDGINADRSTYETVQLTEDALDVSSPTITFPTDLQSAYLPTESITFNVATATDTPDSRISAVTAYRYLRDATDADEETRYDVQSGKVVVESSETTQTLRYIVDGFNTQDENKWYVTSKDENNIVTSEGWYFDTTKSSYTIDLTNKPAEAEYVEILCYAVDDYGNVGFFNRIISIADANDEDMPVVYQVVNAPEASYEAPDTITLPTLYFEDDKVEYMHAEVVVYKLGTDGTKTVVQSTGMSTRFDTYRKVFVVDAGVFNASTESQYQVAITVSDSGNHSNTIYFDYNVTGGVVVEDPQISNITSETVQLEIDETHYLTPPTIAVSNSETYGYVGLDETDDSNTATFYTTSMVSASNSNYELDKYYFEGNAKGTYKLQYTVFLLRYNQTEEYFAGTVDTQGGTDVSSVDAGKMFLDENGMLCYKSEGGTLYYIYLEENEESEDGYDLMVYTNTRGFGGSSLATDNATEYENLTQANVLKKFALKSDVQTFSVQEIVITMTMPDGAYEQTQYEQTGEVIEIVRPQIEVSGQDKGNTIDQEESTVQITITSGNTTETLATIKFSEWENTTALQDDDNFTVQDGIIKLNLIRDGSYTIRYSIQAQDYAGQNVGDPVTSSYTISNGDVVGPTVDFSDEMFKDAYALNDTLTIDVSAENLTLTDRVTTDRDILLKNMTITLVNETTDESWTLDNTSEVEGQYSYSHVFKEAGDYTLTIRTRDTAGNYGEKSVSFTVSTDASTPINVTEVLGGVLIGVSVAILAGVVIYFVVSKVKLDKREKGYRVETDKDKK